MEQEMKPFKKLFLIISITISIIIILFFSLFCLNKGFQEFVLSSISEEETIYAKGYSDKAWKEVNINDTIERVVKLLGDPIKIYRRDDGSSSYYYSDQKTGRSNYKMRVIIFNKEGRVKEKYREFYID
jgi:hypothetical protein